MKRSAIFLVAAITLFIGIVEMPYGYYQLLRWFTCGVGAYGAYISYEKKKIEWVWILGVIALIFNPIFRFYFAKETWKILDFAGGIIFLIFYGSVKNKNK